MSFDGFSKQGRARFVQGQDRPSGTWKPKKNKRMWDANRALAERQRQAREQRAMFRERNGLD